MNDRILVSWDENDPQNPRSFIPVKKWLIVCVISTGSLLVTCTSSIYGSSHEQLRDEFNVSQEVATLGLSLFVVGLAVGPMALSPMSEFYGRRWIYIISMFSFLVFLIPCAIAQNIQTLLVGRFLNGVAGSAFLSVSGGTVADLFIPSQIQLPMMFYTITPFIGPVLGPLIGGFISQFTSWRWGFYILLIWTGLLLACLMFVPETYHPVLLRRKAAALRKSTKNPAYYSTSEDAITSTTISQALIISLYRPFQLLMLEPMCFCLCIYSAIVLGILYLFFGAFPLVFSTNHHFEHSQTGLTFLGLMVGMVIGVFTNPFWHKNYLRLIRNANLEAENACREKPVRPDPEFRLPPAIIGGVLVTLGLFWFGWTTYVSVHWIVPIVGSGFFGLGMFLVFNGIFTFLVDAYMEFAASALAANVFVRCTFAAAFPLFGEQMYKKMGYQWASSLLAFLTFVMVPFPYVFFRFGKRLRERSRFAKL
ncbi:major facilitator superfamily domain-containing protein [Tricladium varicosporioides]|nr:major facilitator superfamily domain-containing protein [Hymenoscyphus varicosporioides]